MIIREINPAEIPFLGDMLYEAIYVPEGMDKLPRDIIKQPELYNYIKDFGRKGDYCLVALVEDKLAGAVWTRLFPADDKGYGFVDEETPELSMALYAPYRGKGIGKQLLHEMIELLTHKGYRNVSLSVDKENFAYDLYDKFGFTTFESNGKSAIMIKMLE